MHTTLFKVAERFQGIKEIPGDDDNPFILSMLRLDQGWPKGDEVPWCSAFVNYVCWLLRVPRSKSLRARSWLQIGEPVSLDLAQIGYDIVVMNRGTGDPDPDNLNDIGHVGFFAGVEREGERVSIWILGGNQGNTVSKRRYDARDLLGVRRLHRPSSL